VHVPVPTATAPLIVNLVQEQYKNTTEFLIEKRVKIAQTTSSLPTAINCFSFNSIIKILGDFVITYK
jgi:hypothetical protein